MKERKIFGVGKKCLLGASLLLATSGFAVLGSCSEGVEGYTIPNDTTIEVGAIYTPHFALESGVEATIVKLQAPLTSKSYIKEGSFTPDVTGEYTYVVRFRQAVDGGVKEAEEKITVKAVDTTAPVISAIAGKQVEIGEYNQLAEDLAGITVTDNCAQYVNVYAESVVYGGETTLLSKDVQSLTLSSVGEYTINVVAEDFSGNKARASYKLNATDTTAPIIHAPSVAIAWAENGKVTLPMLNVIDAGQYTVETTLRNSAGTEISINEDNTANLSAGVYTIEYLVSDASNNEASKTIKFIVNQTGVISDFNEAGEDELWTAYGLRIENGALGVYDKRSSTATLQYTEGFTVGDWSTYVSFDAEIKNNRGAYLFVTPHFYVNGAWVETATQTLKANELKTVKVYLSDYDITKVDGVKFVLNCDGGVDALVNSVNVSKTADNRTAPTTGYTAYDISARGSREITVNQEANNKGVVKYTIYANVDCDIMTTLKYANGSVISSQSLKAGYNEITRYPDAEAGETLTNSKLESLIVANVENYGVQLYVVNAFTYEAISSIDVDAYARTEGEFTVDFNETFAIPSPFTSSLRWYQDLTISVKQGNSTKLSGLTIGDLVDAGENGLSAGNYEIVYSFKDLAGASKTITYTLEVKQNVLTATLTMPTLFSETTDFELPDPVITSVVYGNAVVQQGATVNKYYRILGKKTWSKAVDGEAFAPVPNKTYEIRYTIEYQGTYREIYEQKFIHADAYTLDFETDESLTENLAFMGEDPNNPGSYIRVRQRYLYDGGIYNYRTTRSDIFLWPTKDWSKSGQQSLTVFSTIEGATTIVLRPIIANDKGINAISFWMKSDRTIPNFYVNIGIGLPKSGDVPFVGNGWRDSEPFDLLQGEHFYTVYLKEPVDAFESISAFGMVMPYAVRMYIDDVSFKHIDRLEIEDTNAYENQLDHSSGYELTKPIVSSDVLSAEELAKVSYVLTYSLNGKDPVEVKPDENGNYVLKLAEDEYGEVEFKWTVTTPNIWSSEGGVITRTAESPIVMIKATRLNIEHDEIVKQDADIKLDAPTTMEGELSNVTVEYNATGEWVQMQEVDGKFVLPTETYGWYQLRYTGDIQISDTLTVKGIAMSEIYVRNKYVLVDFEGSDPYLGGTPYFNTRGGGSIPGGELEYDPETRNTVQKVLIVNDSAEGIWFANSLVFEETYNILNVKLYASKPLSNYPVQIYAGMSTSTMKWQEVFINLNAGWNDVYIEYPPFKAFGSFIARMHSSFGSVKIDDISLLSIEFSDELPEIVYYGEETTLPIATLKGVQSSVSYRVKGSAEWTPLEGKFNPETIGTYEVRFAFDGISEMIKEISVELESEELKNFVSKAKTGETITVPTLEAGTESSTAFYRMRGTEEWTAVPGGAFIVENAGTYEVKFYFAGIDAQIIKTITVTPANEFLITDFETPTEPDSATTFYTNLAHVYTYKYNDIIYGVLKSLYPEASLGTPTKLHEWNDDGTGNHVFHMVNAQGYDGPYWLNGGINFGFYTNTFKIKMNLAAPKSNFYFYIIYWDDDDKRHEDTITVDWVNRVDLGNGWYDYTITIPNATNRVSCFEMWTCYFDIDDIRAIDPSK